MSESNLKKTNEKIAEVVTEGYKKIEDGVVEGFSKMTDKFVDKFLLHEGESVEDAKKRLENGQAAREAASKEAREKQAMAGNGTDIGHASVKARQEIARASIEASKNGGKH